MNHVIRDGKERFQLPRGPKYSDSRSQSSESGTRICVEPMSPTCNTDEMVILHFVNKQFVLHTKSSSQNSTS